MSIYLSQHGKSAPKSEDPERRVLRFRNGGVVRMDWHADESRWTINWAAYP